uniref:Cystatin domain-containing protein n=1 Tax=Globisporangium ultimum (strain ATCC 200006 / CBS 805.95 / DAOM BR144) TaxID=431595 RepID=K3X6G7_GLOUD
MSRLITRVIPCLLLLLQSSFQVALAADAEVGGWTSVPVTANATSLLDKALQNESNYRDTVTARVCVFEVHNLSEQVVAGTNYKYEVQACLVSATVSAGLCAVKTLTTNASCADYTIQIFEQVWTNTLEVTSIEKSDSSGSGRVDSSSPAIQPAGSGSAGSDTDSSHNNHSSIGIIVTSTPTSVPTPASTAPAAVVRVLAAVLGMSLSSYLVL